MRYESRVEIASTISPEVRFVLRRMSFGRRLELARKVREISARLEFHEAGDTTSGRVEAAILRAEIDRVSLLWGLEEIRGLEIDGAPCTVERAIEDGPEDLLREAVHLIQRECRLSEEERKNCGSPSSSSM